MATCSLVYRGYHPLRNGDSYQYDLTWVPTGLPVLVYWDEPRRSTYHFTSSIRIRLARPRCRGNRHGLQPAARPGLIERACSKTAGGRRLGHFSRTAFVTSTSRFGVVSSSRSLLHASDAAQVARGGQCRSRCSRCGPFGPFARPRAALGGYGGHPHRGAHPSVSARASGSGHRGHARVRGVGC